jgi:hypothetical protein
MDTSESCRIGDMGCDENADMTRVKTTESKLSRHLAGSLEMDGGIASKSLLYSPFRTRISTIAIEQFVTSPVISRLLKMER